MPRPGDANAWAGRADGGTTEGAITMTEIVFYQLQRPPLERVLPTLIEKSLELGWRVIVQAASEERVEALDAQLWTFRDDSFLPHGTWREAEASEQPILLTLDGDNPNGAAVRFLIDGAPMPMGADAYQRIVLIVDGEDPDAGETARQRWSDGKAKGLDVTYWRPGEEGGWGGLGWFVWGARCRSCGAIAWNLRCFGVGGRAVAPLPSWPESVEISPPPAAGAEGNDTHVPAHRLCDVGDSGRCRCLFYRARHRTKRAGGGEPAGLPGDVFSVPLGRLGHRGADHAAEGAASISSVPA